MLSHKAKLNQPLNQKVLVQLKRIRGQVDGVLRMYQDEQDCVETVRQILAARNSLASVARELLTTEACKCGREQKVDQLDQVLKELFKY